MALSHYLKILPLPGDEAKRLLFSTRTGGLVVLGREALAALRDNRAPADLTAALTRLSLVVDDPARERAEMADYLSGVNRVNPNLRVAVILGMACNFACVYCYEGSLKGSAAMGDATAAQLVDFLLARFRAGGKHRLTLDFYGGEPLLYLPRIRSLAARLRPAIEALGGYFSFTLVSNGSLLSRPVVDELVALGLVSVKVTVDGSAASHDRQRPFKDGRPSWTRIIDNLFACRGACRITLSGNYTADSAAHFPRLLDTLLDRGFTPADFASVQFFPVMQISDRFANPEFTGGCCSNDEPWVHATSLALREEILQRGFYYPKLSPSPCMVELDDGLTVDHDGTLYKCVTLIGHPEFACGDIWQGMRDGWQQTYCLDHWRREPQCRDCVYLPLCFGGCRAMAWQREGTMARVDCQRALFDATLAPMLAQDLRYRYGRVSSGIQGQEGQGQA
ncbi:MAG: putative geopeptide radical SAM maturase [Desulfobulbaceae bacterium A2]|nr:MAG: putative geopeptide radical SAM maturase [Desulfobulbaceae bacterium A2]